MDPKFLAAYSYGATVLPASDVDQAIALTEKVSQQPGQWRFIIILAIFTGVGEFRKGIEVYSKGAEVSGAAPFARMAASEVARRSRERPANYMQLAVEGEDQQTRDNAELGT